LKPYVFDDAPPPPGGPCAWIDYVAQELGSGSSFVRNAIDKEYEITTIGGGFNGFSFFNYADGFNSEVSSASFEVDVISAADPNGGLAAVFFQGVGPSQILVAGIFNQAGTLLDAVLGSPIGGATFQTGYIAGITFDFATGTAFASDNAFLSNYSCSVSEQYDSFIDLNFAWFGASLVAGTNIYSPNTGDRPFALPQSTGNGFCNLVPVPPPVFCAVQDGNTFLTLNYGEAPNTQALSLSGANNLTVTAEVTQTSGAVNSGFAANEVFNTQTEEIKIETTITKVPSGYNGAAPYITLGFFHDVFTPTPVLITALTYIPNVFGGILVDTDGAIRASGVVFSNPATMAVYISPITQPKKYAFQVNTGIAGDITVHGVTSPVSAFDQQEDIAAVIVSNGFTDPTIQSLTIDPSDNRTVVITYTEASGDAAVSISATNGITWYEDTSRSQPYQTGQSRVKFSLALDDYVFDMPIKPAYNKLQDVYMICGLNAGDIVTPNEELIQTINFGSSGFALDEDAERWCNVPPNSL
jgi:hypothetical protein